MFLRTYSWRKIKELAGTKNKYNFWKEIFEEAGLRDITFDVALPQDWLDGVVKEYLIEYNEVLFSTVWVYSEEVGIFGRPVTVLRNLEHIIGPFEVSKQSSFPFCFGKSFLAKKNFNTMTEEFALYYSFLHWDEIVDAIEERVNVSEIREQIGSSSCACCRRNMEEYRSSAVYCSLSRDDCGVCRIPIKDCCGGLYHNFLKKLIGQEERDKELLEKERVYFLNLLLLAAIEVKEYIYKKWRKERYKVVLNKSKR